MTTVNGNYIPAIQIPFVETNEVNEVNENDMYVTDDDVQASYVDMAIVLNCAKFLCQEAHQIRICYYRSETMDYTAQKLRQGKDHFDGWAEPSMTYRGWTEETDANIRYDVSRAAMEMAEIVYKEREMSTSDLHQINELLSNVSRDLSYLLY